LIRAHAASYSSDDHGDSDAFTSDEEEEEATGREREVSDGNEVVSEDMLTNVERERERERENGNNG
jgi:hypothetical protein